MEIRVEAHLTGRQLRDRILREYGSREALVTASKRKNNTVAQSDLVDIQLFEEDPRRLDLMMRIEEVMLLEKDDLQKLTPERLRILEHLGKLKRPLNVSKLAAAMGRNKANVSEDLQILGDLGLVLVRRRGREVLPELYGTTISLQLAAVDE